MMTSDRLFPTPDVGAFDAGTARRVLMTVSCRDSDGIHKVDDAGQLQVRDGQPVQVMHNGLLIEEGSYYGSWMTEIIRGLGGHHEPQEELIFDAIVSRLATSNVDHPTIIEFGSFWSYYSLWFCRALDGARAIAMEPDPAYLDVGRRNARLNGLAERVDFLHGVVGAEPGVPMDFRTQSTDEDIPVVQHDLASLMDLYGLSQVDLAMVDIQGAETVLLDRARPMLKAGSVRFIVVSTHHQSISGDPLTHQKALELLRDCGAHIIAEHTVRESYSGDGLIAATFDPSQDDLTVPISHARARESLFGEPEYELADLDREIARRDRSLAASRAEVARIHQTRLWRWSSVPRALYGRVRRLARRR
jgi:FkbM family methyltransferase